MGRREEIAKLQNNKINVESNPNVIDMYLENNNTSSILYAPASEFISYPNEKIRLRLLDGEKREQLKQSIIKNGVIEPAIVTLTIDNEKMIIAGHNRCSICAEINENLPYRLIPNLTQEQADLICIDTNLLNRQLNDCLISELAWLLRTKWEITREQGKRNDLETSCKTCEKSDSVEDEFKMSKRNIQYYIRLTYLTEELLQMVDDKKISVQVGVALSNLKANEMIQLQECVGDYKLTQPIAEELKRLSQESSEDIDVKAELDKQCVGEKKVSSSIKFSQKDFKGIAPKGEIITKEIIVEALKQFYKA